MIEDTGSVHNEEEARPMNSENTRELGMPGSCAGAQSIFCKVTHLNDSHAYQA
jgi:hypothetical protein